jgi:hypothetical protein
MDRALKGIEYVLLARNRDLDRFVVLVAAYLANRHATISLLAFRIATPRGEG